MFICPFLLESNVQHSRKSWEHKELQMLTSWAKHNVVGKLIWSDSICGGNGWVTFCGRTRLMANVGHDWEGEMVLHLIPPYMEWQVHCFTNYFWCYHASGNEMQIYFSFWWKNIFFHLPFNIINYFYSFLSGLWPHRKCGLSGFTLQTVLSASIIYFPILFQCFFS